MIKLSVMYPNIENLVFDKEYYCNVHVPLVSKLLGNTLKNSQVDFGLVGDKPGSTPLYAVITQMTFDSIESFEAIFAVHAEEILSDISNFTNAQPQIQISEIII